jgi:hypothetical protein
MDVKKILGTLFTLVGAVGIVLGIIRLFNGQVSDANSWIFSILGIIFFGAGVGLLKSIRTIETK